MKLKNLVSKRYKEMPADCQIASLALMMRGGYIKSVGNGIFTLFPVTKRITSKIEKIIREEMDRIDGQEVLFPVAMPASMWQESGRYDSIGIAMCSPRTREAGADLGKTHALHQSARSLMNCTGLLSPSMYSNYYTDSSWFSQALFVCFLNDFQENGWLSLMRITARASP